LSDSNLKHVYVTDDNMKLFTVTYTIWWYYFWCAVYGQHSYLLYRYI